MTIWQDKTCEKCIYRVGMNCRRFPPEILHAKVHNAQAFYPRYPGVVQAGHHDQSKNGHFIEACAEYAEAEPNHSNN